MSKNIKDRIAELQKEQEQLKARTQQLQNKFNASERKVATCKKIVIGALILKDIENNEAVRKYVIRLLGSATERDKILFSELMKTT